MKDIIPILLVVCVLNSCNTMMSVNAADRAANAAHSADRSASRAASFAEDNNREIGKLGN